jgi:hypothetical protein
MTSEELLIDGTFFKFPPSWQTEVFDEWPQYKRAAGELELRGCDVLALDGQDLWIIEMKDYTYEGASQPQDLHKTVGQKAAGTLALLFALSRTAADSPAKEFAIKCASSTRVNLALHVIVKDGGRREKQIKAVLLPVKQKLDRSKKALGLHKAHVTSTLAPNANTPWSARRDPHTRAAHSDR